MYLALGLSAIFPPQYEILLSLKSLGSSSFQYVLSIYQTEHQLPLMKILFFEIIMTGVPDSLFDSTSSHKELQSNCTEPKYPAVRQIQGVLCVTLRWNDGYLVSLLLL